MTMSSTGLTVCLEVLSVLDPLSENTITSPSVMLVVYAPSRYPTISRFGFGSNSMTVTAASSDGLNIASSASRKMSSSWLLMAQELSGARVQRPGSPRDRPTQPATSHAAITPTG